MVTRGSSFFMNYPALRVSLFFDVTRHSDWFPNFRLIRPLGHPPPDRFCDGTQIGQVRLIGEEDAMQRERHIVNRAGAQRGRPARARYRPKRQSHRLCSTRR